MSPDSGQPALRYPAHHKRFGLDPGRPGFSQGYLPKLGCAGRRESCSWIEDWEPRTARLELNPALLPADEKDDNMAADMFAPDVGQASVQCSPQLLPRNTDTEATYPG